MIIVDCVQGTPEWDECRLGIPTASEFDKILTTKGEPSKQAQKYLYRLAGERVSRMKEDFYKNAIMERGNVVEEEARHFYDVLNDVTVERVGFCYGNESKTFGCSPDGLVGKDGLVEIKCPIQSTHVGYLLDGGLPMDYFQQVQGELFVTGRKWLDFISYYPAIKPLVVRVVRDEKFIRALTIELEVFCRNLNEIVEKIKIK